MKIDCEIKKLTQSDLLLAKQLIRQWHDEDEISDPIPGDHYLNTLLSKDTFHVFVARASNHVVGGLTAYELPMFPKEEDEMFLYEIGVHEDYRKLGIARKLIEQLKQTCRDKGITTIFVGTSTDNELAKQLYKATGGAMEEISWFTYDVDRESTDSPGEPYTIQTDR